MDGGELYRLLVQHLWAKFISTTHGIPHQLKSIKQPFDHFAIIDFKGPDSGQDILEQIFQTFGLVKYDSGYLPKKYNDFSWMGISDDLQANANLAAPQAVIADFRHELLTKKNRIIVEKCLSYVKPFDFEMLNINLSRINSGKSSYIQNVLKLITNYIYDRPWPLPNTDDYLSLEQENPLMAWVLLFGRKINHFGISVYLMSKYSNLLEYCNEIEREYKIEFNRIDGLIKGDPKCGIEQSSTQGVMRQVSLNDGSIDAKDSFLEFVWRHSTNNRPKVLGDYFNGFIAGNATNVVESLLKRNIRS